MWLKVKGRLVQYLEKLNSSNLTKANFQVFGALSFWWQIMFLTLPTRLSAEPTTSVKLGRRSAGLPGRECDSRSVARLPLDSPGLLPVTTTKCTIYSNIKDILIFEHYSCTYEVLSEPVQNPDTLLICKKTLLSL